MKICSPLYLSVSATSLLDSDTSLVGVQHELSSPRPSVPGSISSSSLRRWGCGPRRRPLAAAAQCRTSFPRLPPSLPLLRSTKSNLSSVLSAGRARAPDVKQEEGRKESGWMMEALFTTTVPITRTAMPSQTTHLKGGSAGFDREKKLLFGSDKLTTLCNRVCSIRNVLLMHDLLLNKTPSHLPAECYSAPKKLHYSVWDPATLPCRESHSTFRLKNGSNSRA